MHYPFVLFVFFMVPYPLHSQASGTCLADEYPMFSHLRQVDTPLQELFTAKERRERKATGDHRQSLPCICGLSFAIFAISRGEIKTMWPGLLVCA